MTAVMKALNRLVSPKKRLDIPKSGVEGMSVLFHRDTADLQASGRIIASSTQYHFQHKPVRFVLVGMAPRQQLTPAFLTWLWAEAEVYGLRVHYLEYESFTGIVTPVAAQEHTALGGAPTPQRFVVRAE